jgi:hypothetical protein
MCFSFLHTLRKSGGGVLVPNDDDDDDDDDAAAADWDARFVICEIPP